MNSFFTNRCTSLDNPPDGKVTKGSPGTAPDEHFVLIVAFPRTPFTGVIPLLRQRISGAQNLSDTLNSRRATGPFVVAKSAQLRFRLTAKTAHASLLLLSQSGPAVVDPLWVPFVGPRAAAHKRGKRNPRQTAGISAKSKNYSSMSMTTLFPRCGQSHESFAFAGTLLIEMLRAAKPPDRKSVV